MNTQTSFAAAVLMLATLTAGCAQTSEEAMAGSRSNIEESDTDDSRSCVHESSPGTAADDYERLHESGTTSAGPEIVRQILAKSCLNLQTRASALPDEIFPDPEGTRAHDAIEAFLAQDDSQYRDLTVDLEGTQHELFVTVHMITKDDPESDSADDWSFTFTLPETGYVTEDTVSVEVAAP